MTSQLMLEFRWLSPLGISVALFMIYGAFYVLIGALTPVMMNTQIGQQVTFSSSKKDSVLLGGPLTELLQTSPALAKIRRMLLNVIGGLLVAAGILVMTVTWFGLKQAQVWALVALALAGVVVLPFWWLVFRPFAEAGIAVGLDLPPFMLLPGILLAPATVFGWIGLR